MNFRATYFLSLPLYNSRSKSQLESFAHRLRNDEYAEGIPNKCFTLPTSFHIHVVSLRLETSYDVKAASNLLRNLDVQRILKDAAASSTTAKTTDSHGEEDRKSKTRTSFETLIPPLQISLPGLQLSNSGQLTDLFSRISDPSDRVRGLVRSVRGQFASAGFRLYSGLRDNEEEYVQFKTLGCTLLARKGFKTTQTFVNYAGTIVSKKRMVGYDVTPLFQRYENVEIAKDVVIEKLSLCKEGRKRTFRGDKNEFVVDEYFEEIDSIPMPQES